MRNIGIELIASMLIIWGILPSINTRGACVYCLAIVCIGVVLWVISYTHADINLKRLILQWDAAVGIAGITGLSGVLIILLTALLKSLPAAAVIGLFVYMASVYLYLQTHEEYHSLGRREGYEQRRRERPSQRRRQPATQRQIRRREPLRTKGFSKVSPAEYSKIPDDAIEPFTHSKIHDLISGGNSIMKCNECGAYYDKEVWEYYGKICARLGCVNKPV